MKKFLAVALVMMAMGGMALAQGDVEKVLLDLERQWVKASSDGDGDALAPLLAADFVSVQSDGTTQTKAVYVANARKGKWQVNDVSDMKVHVHGDSAVVIGIWTGKGTDGTGKPFDGRERFVDTWVKTPDGKWQCVASAGVTMK
jgi:ketosteroid isomerase-like protein